MLAQKTPGRTFPLLLVLANEDILQGQRLGPLRAMLGPEGSNFNVFPQIPSGLVPPSS